MKFTTHLELHSQTTRLVEGVSPGLDGRSHTGFSPSMTSCSKELRPASRPKHPLQITTRAPSGPDSKFELLPLHSPLLGQSLLVSFPPLIDMLKFSGYPYLIRGQPLMTDGGWLAGPARGIRSDVVYYYARSRPGLPLTFGGGAPGAGGPSPRTKRGLREANDARTGMPLGMPGGAMCVQRFDDSLNSAIRITYRISLRSSSMPEPRDPLLKVFGLLVDCSSDATGFTGFRKSSRRAPRGRSPPGLPPKRRRYGAHGVKSRGGWPLKPGFALGNDPSAGSPTETLLRLLLPLNDQV